MKTIHHHRNLFFNISCAILIAMNIFSFHHISQYDVDVDHENCLYHNFAQDKFKNDNKVFLENDIILSNITEIPFFTYFAISKTVKFFHNRAPPYI